MGPAGQDRRWGQEAQPPRRIHVHGYAFDASYVPAPDLPALADVPVFRTARPQVLVRFSSTFGRLPVPFMGIAVALHGDDLVDVSDAGHDHQDLLFVSAPPWSHLAGLPLITWRPLRATYSTLSTYRMGGRTVRLGCRPTVDGFRPGVAALTGLGLLEQVRILADRVTLDLRVAPSGQAWQSIGTVVIGARRPDGDLGRYSPTAATREVAPNGRLVSLRTNVYGRAQLS